LDRWFAIAVMSCEGQVIRSSDKRKGVATRVSYFD